MFFENASAPKLTIPWEERVSLTKRQIAFILFGAATMIGVVFLLATAQWPVAKKLYLKMIKRQNEEKLKALDTKARHNRDLIIKERALREDLQAQRKGFEKKRIEAKLRLKGLSHEKVVAELQRRGF